MTSRHLFPAIPILAVLTGAACNLRDQPVFVEYRRPDNVPSDATLTSSGKGGYWKRCAYADDRKFIRCQVFNWRGGALFDEVFLPYDEGPSVSQAELKITRTPRQPVDYQVELENGRILLPQSRYKELKAFMDRLK